MRGLSALENRYRRKPAETMQFVNILEAAMWSLFVSVFLFYASYFLVLYFFYRRARLAKKPSDFFYPTVSLIVPTFNEETAIDKKIQNVEDLRYPNERIEIIFVDGHSSDKTLEIIKNHMTSSKKSVRLIEQNQREGYTRGIIKGISSSKGDVIVITDAAAYYYPDAIEHLVKHFRDYNVGAVTGKEIVVGDGGKLGPLLEESYRLFYDFMREAETEIDSTPDSKGEILAIRREICTSLIANLERSTNASFDSCVPYQARLMGYRTIYDPQAKYYEYAPVSFMDRMRQQIRRATVLIGALFLFKGILLRRRYGRFGSMILPVHFVMQCLLPWLFLLGAGCLLVLTFIDPMKTVALWIVATVAIIASRKSRMFLISFIQSQLSLVIAIFRLASRKESLFINTIPSTRKRTS